MPKGYTHCVHLSVFLDITLHFISSTLGDIVNVNVKQTWYQCFSFSITRTSSSLVLVPFFSCQMVMRMLGMRQLLCGGEYISNIHLRLSNFVVYHIFTTWWPFDVSVSFGIYIYIYICHRICENQAYGIIINFEIRVKIGSYGLLR